MIPVMNVMVCPDWVATRLLADGQFHILLHETTTVHDSLSREIIPKMDPFYLFTECLLEVGETIVIKLRKQMDPNLLLRGGTQGSRQHCELLEETSVVDPDPK
jgi:hypothetical protein